MTQVGGTSALTVQGRSKICEIRGNVSFIRVQRLVCHAEKRDWDLQFIFYFKIFFFFKNNFPLSVDSFVRKKDNFLFEIFARKKLAGGGRCGDVLFQHKLI